MRGAYCLGALLALVVVCFGQAANPSAAPLPPERIEGLIKQLGSSRYADREKAQRDLEAIGPPALEPLRKASASDDQEVARRAGNVVRKLDAALLAAKLLAPRRVNLRLKNVGVPAALAELTRQSGYPIRIAGTRTALDKRKVTLATGDVTFWEAFDALCLEARLVGTMPVVAGANVDPFAVPPAPGSVPLAGNAQLIVKDGKPLAQPTCYVGAIRIRALPFSAAADQRAGEVQFLLEISPEPHLEYFALTGSPTIRKVSDDKGQTLASHSYEGPVRAGSGESVNRAAMVNRLVPLRFKLGEKPADALKQLQGTLAARVLTPAEPLVVVEDVQKAVGKTVKGKEGSSVCILGMDKADNGDIQVQVRMANLPPHPLRDPQVIPIGVRGRGPGFGKARVRRVGGDPSVIPTLLDGKGRSFAVVQILRHVLQVINGEVTEEVSLVYRPQPGQDGPARLVLNSQRLVTIPVAFSLADVPLR